MNQNERWYYARGKETVGPISLADLRSALLRGEVKAGDLVYHETLGQWMAAGKVAILQNVFTAAPPVSSFPINIKSSQPRSTTTAKNVTPPSNKVAPKNELKSEQASPTIDLGLNILPTGKVETKKSDSKKVELKKSDSGKSNSAKTEQPAGAGTLFDVTEDISEPDEVIADEKGISGGQMLIEKGTPLDFIPNMLRAGFPGMVANTMGKFFASAGVWIQLIGIGLIIAVILKYAGTNLSVLGKTLGMFGCPIVLLLATAYINLRLLPSLNRLNNLGEGRIVSNALPDVLSMLFLCLGGYFVVYTFATALDNKSVIILVYSAITSLVYFAMFAFCAVTAANPNSLNMTVDSSLSPSSEAAGAIQYISKLILRLSLALYGFAMTIFALQNIFSIIYNPVLDPGEAITKGLVFIASLWTMIAVSFLPLCTYIMFLGVQFFLDFAIKVVQNTRR